MISKKIKPPFKCDRGMPIYYNTGELSFETRPREAGTFKGTFLEWVRREPNESDKLHDDVVDEKNTYVKQPWFARILNKNDKVVVVHQSLISGFNL